MAEMNPFFRGGRINELLESMSKENYPLLLNLLTNENAENYDPQTDSDDAYNAKENTKSADRGTETSNSITQHKGPYHIT